MKKFFSYVLCAVMAIIMVSCVSKKDRIVNDMVEAIYVSDMKKVEQCLGELEKMGGLSSLNESQHQRIETALKEVQEAGTTETVYKGSSGTTVVLCDDGIAYINGKKGSWTQSYVRLGSNSYEFIKIRQNGMVSEGGIFRGKFYYGRDAEMAIKEDYPDGEPLTSTRR